MENERVGDANGLLSVQYVFWSFEHGFVKATDMYGISL